ncbi:MAG: class SAM-dependent methyltransferase [Paenibacillus sp.]|nr:class SAM-dependent methyltransferase [Paenibacillus sp.]
MWTGMFYWLHQIMLAGLVTVVFLAMLSIVYMSIRNGISPMPASSAVRREAAAEINKLTGRGTLVEAGSGWGTLALHAAKACPGWRIIGIENSVLPLWTSRLLARFFQGSTSVTFRSGDIYTYSYKDANAVICYLYPGAMKRLSSVLADGLAPGATIISICFAVPGWHAERVITCRDLYRTPIYVYTI